MTHGDYVPDSAQNVGNWTDNYIKEIPAIATRISWPVANVTALIALLTQLRDAAQAVLDAQNALKTKAGLLLQSRTDNLPSIRQNTANLKSTVGFTDGDAKTLEVTTSSAVLNPDTYQAVLSAHAHPGYNEVMGKKRGVQAINIYMRVKGTGSWKLIAAGRTTFPFNDDTPPVTPGQPEEREYMGMGVMNDKEIGQPSDIVSAVFRSM